MRAILTFALILLFSAAAACFVYYLFDNQHQETAQTIRAYSVENADKKAKLLAVQLDNRLTLAQKNIEPLASFLSVYDIWNNDFTHRLRAVVSDKDSGITGIAFAFNDTYLRRAPHYFWYGDTLQFKNLASENYWEQDWYKNALQAENTRWTGSNFGNSEIEVVFSQSIKNRDGFLKGVLKTDVVIDDFEEETSAYLIDNTNNQIFYFQEQTILPKGSNSFEDFINGTVSHSEAFISGDASHYIAFAPVQDIDWTVAVIIQNEETPAFSIKTFLQEHKKMLIICAVAFVFVILLLAFFISHKDNKTDHRRIQNRMNVGR